jgi:hypothetical protein
MQHQTVSRPRTHRHVSLYSLIGLEMLPMIVMLRELCFNEIGDSSSFGRIVRMDCNEAIIFNKVCCEDSLHYVRFPSGHTAAHLVTPMRTKLDEVVLGFICVWTSHCAPVG